MAVSYFKKIMQRKVLVILSNRFTPSQPTRYYELVCKDDGTVTKEVRLKRRPSKPAYQEVWENNEGKDSIDSCTRMSKHYKHALLKK